MKIVIVDHRDSFTYNLAHLFGRLGAKVTVVAAHETELEAVERERPSAIVLSPGPGRADDPVRVGVSAKIVTSLGPKLPILGVCLGHQIIGAALGGRIAPARRPLHGRESAIFHEAWGVFAGLPSPFDAMRYHSLVVVDPPAALQITARSQEGEIMGLQHTSWPVFGVQFHPESVGTPLGLQIAERFLALGR